MGNKKGGGGFEKWFLCPSLGKSEEVIRGEYVDEKHRGVEGLCLQDVPLFIMMRDLCKCSMDRWFFPLEPKIMRSAVLGLESFDMVIELK